MHLSSFMRIASAEAAILWVRTLKSLDARAVSKIYTATWMFRDLRDTVCMPKHRQQDDE